MKQKISPPRREAHSPFPPFAGPCVLPLKRGTQSRDSFPPLTRKTCVLSTVAPRLTTPSRPASTALDIPHFLEAFSQSMRPDSARLNLPVRFPIATSPAAELSSLMPFECVYQTAPPLERTFLYGCATFDPTTPVFPDAR